MEVARRAFRRYSTPAAVTEPAKRKSRAV